MKVQRAGLVASPGLHVLRTRDGWAIAPPARRDVVRVDLALVLDLAASTGGRPLVANGPAVDELVQAGALVPAAAAGVAAPTRPPRSSVVDPDADVAPRGGLLARLEGGRAVVEAPDGELVGLDAEELRLLDSLDRRRPVAEVLTGRRWVRRRLRDRLARLHGAGVVRVLDGSEPDDTEAIHDQDEAARLAADRFRVQAFDEDAVVEYLAHPCPTTPPRGAVPVYAPWQLETGPALSLGMLTASARRHDGGALNQHYEIRRPEDPGSILADLARRDGPAVLLLSNYVWCLEHNLAVARRARELCPELVVIHGGPSTPKYEAECEAFLREHAEIAHVAIRGEGEVTLAAALAALAPTWPAVDLHALRDVAGLTYVDPDGGPPVRTADRDRVTDLDELPSPYLTGEFDHLHPAAWRHPGGLVALVLETNRGCPYGCTFCDWGSSTLSRVRKFSLDRVEAEMRWAAERGFGGWMLADANFGIISRDIEVAERVAAIKAELGVPWSLGFNVAKNTTKHLTTIVDRIVAAGVSPHFTLALQTRDEPTLEAVSRSNISTEHYVALASAFRRGGLPLQADLMVGLPGQTVDSFADDLQFLIEHEMPARMWITKLLPNSPMNDPDYRAEHGIVADDQQVVVATTSFTEGDRRAMMVLRQAYAAFEQFGLLRHVLRHLRWDHGIGAMTVLRRIVDLAEEDPARYPLLNWVLRYFDYYNVPPLGWATFFAEVRRFVEDELGVTPDTALDVVLEVSAFLLPGPGRTFPATRRLAHDYVAYHRDHTAHLWGGAPVDHRPLADHAAGSLTVYGDPLDQCHTGVRVNGDPRNEFMQERYWLEGHWELDSPLVVNYPTVAGNGDYRGLAEQLAGAPAPVEPDEPDDTPARVRLTQRSLARRG